MINDLFEGKKRTYRGHFSSSSIWIPWMELSHQSLSQVALYTDLLY